MKYTLTYEFEEIAEVEIDDERDVVPIVKEMVEFWAGWESRLAANDGDLVQTWLKQLAMFILRNDRVPANDEGWYPLDGSHGIKINSVTSWDFDEDEIGVDVQ